MAEQSASSGLLAFVRELDQKFTEGPWIERLARLGYLAKGLLYVAIGLLAFRAVDGTTDADADAREALLTLARGQMGTAILIGLVIGLSGYILWRLYQAWHDTEDKGNGPKGLVQRLAYIGSSFFYAGILFTAIQLLRGLHPGDDSSTQDWTARLLGYSWGSWIIVAAGLVMIGVGIAEAWRGLATKFRKEVREQEMSEREMALFVWAGRLGLSARGLLYGMVGVFLLQAAWQRDPEEAGGLGDALAHLAANSMGPWLLGATALGLIAYGCYALAESRYRRFRGTRD